ncbi:MAG: ABC transporter substrate binding protein [Pseudomonadota bacterium]
MYINVIRIKNLLKKVTLFTLLFAIFGSSISHAYTGVTIILSAPTQTNLEFVEHFKDELISSKNAALRVTMIDLLETDQLVVAENSELVIALGVNALEAASKLKHTTPVVGVFTPLPAFNRLLAASKRDLGNFSSIVLDQPYMRQMVLIKTIMPNVRNLGVLLGKSSSQYAELIKEAGEKVAINVNEENIVLDADLIPKLNKILDTNDALMAIPDPLVYSRETAQPILLTTYRHQKPVFGYSRSYVQAGALAAVYSSTKQLAKQATEIAVKSQAAPGLLPPPQPPKYFSVAVNYQVARSFNMAIENVDKLQKKIAEAELAQYEN